VEYVLKSTEEIFLELLKYIDVDLVNLEYNKKYNIDIENYESQIFTGKKIVKVLNL
jgi:hypothetical protein